MSVLLIFISITAVVLIYNQITGISTDAATEGTNELVLATIAPKLLGLACHTSQGYMIVSADDKMSGKVFYSVKYGLDEVASGFATVDINDTGRIYFTADMTEGKEYTVKISGRSWSLQETCIAFSTGEEEGSGSSYREFYDGFESGSISSNWTQIGNPGTYNRMQVVTSGCGMGPNSGARFLLMDVSSDANYETNVLKTNYDFTGASSMTLEFYHFETGEESHQLGNHSGDYSAGCTGDNPCGDGVFFTCDGTNWIRIAALSTDEPGWAKHSYDLSSYGYWCGTATGSFAIKFMQHDNYACSNDGRGFDDINISYTLS
jgi:hypothetical protein